jgi:hypothetical protein
MQQTEQHASSFFVIETKSLRATKELAQRDPHLLNRKMRITLRKFFGCP